MGANPTQAKAVALSFIGFVIIAGSFAANLNWLLMIIGLAIIGVSLALFLKCKPWEHREE
jgi:uncharacterized membrane protein YbaN (DUF454 family)